MLCDVIVCIFVDAVVAGKRDMFEPMITAQSCVIKQVTSYKETDAKLVRRWRGEYTVFIITLLANNLSSTDGILQTILYNLVRQISIITTQECLAINYTRLLSESYGKRDLKWTVLLMFVQMLMGKILFKIAFLFSLLY